MALIGIKRERELPLGQLVALYESVGWLAYTAEGRREHLATAVGNSTYVVSAWEGDTLVGLVRGLSDDVSIFYLQDILVRPDFQGRGIGKQLLGDCLQRFEHVRMKVLLTDDEEGQRRFYEELGYRNITELTEVRLNAFVRIEGLALE